MPVRARRATARERPGRADHGGRAEPLEPAVVVLLVIYGLAIAGINLALLARL